MNTPGSGRTMLSDWQAVETHPDWSHDGNKIVFTSDTGNAISNPNGDQEIYVMNAGESDALRITDNVGDDYQPKWSPDGTKIAFESQRDGNREIYVMNADGSGSTRLTDNAGNDRHLSWRPAAAPAPTGTRTV